MRSMLWAVVGIAFLGIGCRTVEISNGTGASVIGRPVQSVIQAHAGRRIEMFDRAGEQVQELPRQDRASVSIYNEDQTGQDNYTFDENGLIVKHLRSYGEGYAEGIWEEVE